MGSWKYGIVGGLFASWLLAGAGGCNEAEHEAKLAEVRRQADDRVAKAEREAREKVGLLEKQIETMQAGFADAAAQVKSEAEQAINEAKANADEQAKVATNAVAKARQAYKAEGAAAFKDLASEFKQLSPKANKAPAKDQAAIQKLLLQIEQVEKLIPQDINAFDSATLDDFRNVKAKLKKDLGDMKQLVATLRSKVPTT